MCVLLCLLLISGHVHGASAAVLECATCWGDAEAWGSGLGREADTGGKGSPHAVSGEHLSPPSRPPSAMRSVRSLLLAGTLQSAEEGGTTVASPVPCGLHLRPSQPLKDTRLLPSPSWLALCPLLSAPGSSPSRKATLLTPSPQAAPQQCLPFPEAVGLGELCALPGFQFLPPVSRGFAKPPPPPRSFCMV